MNTVEIPAWLRGETNTAPRYTSYPPAPHFRPDFTAADYTQAAQRSNVGGAPLSLYVHIPFCHSLCYYCACNKIVTKDKEAGRTYLDYLRKELELVAPLYDRQRVVTQLHWGGGTPTYLSDAEMTELMYQLAHHFNLSRAADAEFSIEIDPRTVDDGGMALLRGLGFNRVSLGVQDFDPDVQKAVHRIQSVEKTAAVVNAARRYGFRSVSVDLIYGLPLQTAERFRHTLREVIAMAPDRLSLFHYAHLPQRFFPQNRIHVEDLPSLEEKRLLLEETQAALRAAGYEEIGMDHYARRSDGLFQAREGGELRRNFQGYSTQASTDLIGLGVSSIGQVDNTYVQNHKMLPAYYAALDAGQLPTERGLLLLPDDLLRRDVIMDLLCLLTLDIAALEQRHQIDFSDYFSAELALLDQLPEHWLERGPRHLRILGAGKHYIRFICRLFDRYWSDNPLHQAQYSQVL